MGKSNIEKMCLGKTRYETYEEAEECADYVYKKDGIILYTYKCKVCDGYHLTTQKVKKKVR